jgi:hypothetical protein
VSCQGHKRIIRCEPCLTSVWMCVMPQDLLGEEGSGAVSSSSQLLPLEEYYPTVAVRALMRILRDPQSASHCPTALTTLILVRREEGNGRGGGDGDADDADDDDDDDDDGR